MCKVSRQGRLYDRMMVRIVCNFFAEGVFGLEGLCYLYQNETNESSGVAALAVSVASEKENVSSVPFLSSPISFEPFTMTIELWGKLGIRNIELGYWS